MDPIIIFCARDVVYIVILIAAVALLAGGRRRLRMFATIVVACIFAYITVKIASHVHYEERPFVIKHITPLIPHSRDNGFPSDHALVTAMLTTIMFFYKRWVAWLMLVGTILVGVARVMAHLHSPFQVGAGWVFGAIGAIIAYFLVRYAFSHYESMHPVPTDSGLTIGK